MGDRGVNGRNFLVETRHPQSSGFADYLVANGKISEEERSRADNVATKGLESFENVLTRLGLVTEKDLALAFSIYLDLPIAQPSDYPTSPILEGSLTRRFVRDGRFIPLNNTEAGLAVALANPFDAYVCEAISFAVGKPVVPYIALPADLDAAFLRLYGKDQDEERRLVEAARERSSEGVSDDLDRLKDGASDAPVIKLVNQLIQDAVERNASDIHIEPMENELVVRIRIDGVLQRVPSPPRQLADAITSRIKVMTRLNIAERRLPQDGRISLAVRGKDIDLRVSTIPAKHGESVVLRILDREHVALNFAALGIDDDHIRELRGLLSQPHGILLATGPTGSGKTTTLYASLLELNTGDRKILTVEDPVEYQLDGINQVQVKPQIGLTFASALRAFLRQDPDIMMVGEIRDLETAQIAVQSALTGHLILSTLHTNDAASAITRLLDMGVEDYLLSATLTGVFGQRLVRKPCVVCREPYTPLPELQARLGLDKLANGEITLYRARGCKACGNTGYRGRTSIFEILPITDQVRRAMLRRTDAGVLDNLWKQTGIQTMRMNGLKRALEGATTLDEVFRVTGALR